MIWILLGLAAVFCIIMLYDTKRFEVRQYRVESAGQQPFRFVFLSDLHEKDYGNGNASVLEAIRSAEPEAVLIGGDMIISSAVMPYGDDWMKNSLDFIRKLAGICPVYMVYGNHELRIGEMDTMTQSRDKTEQAFTSAGAVLLHNSSVLIHNIRITGFEQPMYYYSKFRVHRMDSDIVEDLCGPSDPSRFQILLTHDPAYADSYAQWGADLALAGHCHGGLMRFPGHIGAISPTFHLFPRHAWGLTSCGRKRKGLILTGCGLGSHTLPIRIFNPGEISVVDIVPSQKDTNTVSEHD